jgi:hypothetical protein
MESVQQFGLHRLTNGARLWRRVTVDTDSTVGSLHLVKIGCFSTFRRYMLPPSSGWTLRIETAYTSKMSAALPMYSQCKNPWAETAWSVLKAGFIIGKYGWNENGRHTLRTFSLAEFNKNLPNVLYHKWSSFMTLYKVGFKDDEMDVDAARIGEYRTCMQICYRKAWRKGTSIKT